MFNKEKKSQANLHNIKFSIRPINIDDIKAYRSVLDSVAKEQKFLSFFEAPSFDSTSNFVKNNIQCNWPHLVAEVDNNIVGWCDISSLERPIFHHVGVLGIGILASYRGLGIGKALVIKALKLAQDKGLKRVELKVRENNFTAIHLYEKLGFKIEGHHLKAICIDGHYENEISMAILF